MTEPTIETNGVDWDTIPERYIEINYIYRLKDGRTIEEYGNSMYHDPEELDFSNMGPLMDRMENMKERGFEPINPIRIGDHLANGDPFEVAELPQVMAITWENIASVDEKVIIHNLTEDHVKEILEQRERRAAARARQAELQELRAQAEKVEAELGIAADGVKYVGKPKIGGTDEDPVSYMEIPFHLEDGKFIRLRFSPELAGVLGHALIGGPHSHHDGHEH